VLWSRECYRIFGLPEGTPMTVESFMASVHPADRERLGAASRAATEQGVPFDLEHRVQRPDGCVCWVRERAVVERDVGGQPIRMVGTVQDITDRHVALDELQASEQRYRRIIENTSEGVWTYDALGMTTFMNSRLASLLGYTVEEAVGQSIRSFLTESSLLGAQTRLDRRRAGVAERVDAALLRKDGALLWTSIQVNPLFDERGVFEGALALVTDVSGQRQAAEARARLAAIVESSEDAILSTTLDGTITTWNRAAEMLYQYSTKEMVGRSVLQLVPIERIEDARNLLESAGDGRAVRQYETTRRRKDGVEIEVALTVSPVRDATGTVIGVSKIARDLTLQRQIEATLRRTEEQFRHAQKMEAVGRLAGGVAHDFNNLLSVILSFASFARDDLQPGTALYLDIEQIEVAANRAAGLTRQLLAFSRQQVLQPCVLDLNRIIADMKSMLGRLLGEDVEVITCEAANLGRVLADQGQIEQVVMNLAVNARDAMPEGGKLTIETANVTVDLSHAGLHIGTVPGDYVRITISDTGFGMDEMTKARVFEPFFTTKERGKGTGLGLSTVFGIVEQSGGHIELSSEPGRGCTFSIYLPRTHSVAPVVTSAGLPKKLTGAETILLVEDEAQVRAAAGTILRRNGYDVLEASNGSEALLTSKDRAGVIHLLLTDVVMPRMGGRRLAEQIAAARPNTKVLYVSGYTDDSIVRQGVLDAGLAFLQKPFTPETLLNKVREVLDAPTGAQEASRLSIVREGR
jgi:two-component system cell cycle sensor histidine kinase/response regulator CckA